MDSHDLPRIDANLNLKLSLKFLRFIGNWPPRKNYQRKYYYAYSIFFLIFIIGFYIFVQISFFISVWGNIDGMISGSFLLMTNTGNFYKMIVVLWHNRRIQELENICDSDVFACLNKNYERIFSYYAWNGIFHHVTYQCLGGISIFCWAIGSLLNIVKNNDKRLPIYSWYPYDVEKSPNFEISLVHQIIGEMILCFHNIALDILVTNLIGIACCQVEILKRNVCSIGNDDDDDDDGENSRAELASMTSNVNARRKLNSCIEHNKAIIHFKKEIQEIFGTSILYQCFVNCAIICLTAFHISRNNDYVPAEIVGTALYLCGMTYQIFIYCWHGNELSIRSESIATAAYSGNWWKFDKRYKSSLRILMIRSRRPLVITVGKIMILSLETFTSILRMSYSLFTVLQSSTTDVY